MAKDSKLPTQGARVPSLVSSHRTELRFHMPPLKIPVTQLRPGTAKSMKTNVKKNPQNFKQPLIFLPL